MGTTDKENILRLVTEFFINSHDFNGIHINELLEQSDLPGDEFETALSELVRDGLVGILYADTALNPHIIRMGFEDAAAQIKKLHGVFGPTPVHPSFW